MPDSRGNMDRDFIHKSWLEMEAILDREMPVIHQRKRRFLVLLFLFLAVVFSSLWLTYAYQSSNVGIALIDDINKDASDKTTATNSIRSDEDRIEDQTEISNEELMTGGISSASRELPAINSTTTQNIDTEPLNQKKTVTSNEGNSSKPMVNIDNAIVETIAGNNQVDKDQQAGATEVIADETANNQSNPLIKLKDIAFLEFPSLRPVIIGLVNNNTIEYSKKLKPLQEVSGSSNDFGLYVSNRVIDYQSFNMEMGAGYIRKIKWLGLFGEIGYGLDSYKEQNIILSSLGSRFTGDNSIESNVLSSINSTELSKGNYLSLAAGVNLALYGGLSAKMGLQKRFFNISQQVQDAAVDVAAEGDVTSPTQAGDMNTYQLTFNNQNDIYLDFGLGYDITRRLIINASYKFQLNAPYNVDISSISAIQSQQFLEKRRELRLGLWYKL